MPFPSTDQTIKVPLNVLRRSYGFALDLGTSTTKVAYRSKYEYINGEPHDKNQIESAKGCIHLTLFPDDHIEEVISYIKSHCDLLENKSQNTVHACGHRLNDDVKTLFEKELDCQMVMEDEGCMSSNGLVYLLKTFKAEDIFYNPSPSGLKRGKAMSDFVLSHTKDNKHTRGKFFQGPPGDVFVERKDEAFRYPVLLADMGATFRFQKILEGNKCEWIHSTSMGGLFFHGICGFFSDTKDYPTLLKIAEQSNGKTVELTMRDFEASFPKDAEETIYNRKLEMDDDDKADLRFFIMDKMVSGSREDAKIGDGVHSLLQTVCENSVSHIFCAARRANVKKIYISGSFIHPALVRKWITSFLLMKNTIAGWGDPVEFEFLQLGSSLGALGAFLQSSQ